MSDENVFVDVAVVFPKPSLSNRNVAAGINSASKGRTIKYLRGGGGLGKYQKKIHARRKDREKISCTTNLLKKKIEQVVFYCHCSNPR